MARRHGSDGSGAKAEYWPQGWEDEVIYPGSEITQEQAEFGAAMNRERKRLGRFLDFTDVLRVARELGYKKCSEH